MKVLFKGREVEIDKVTGKYEDDLMVEKAYYTDDDTELDEEELDELQTEYASDIHQMWYEDKCCEAEYYYDGD